MGQVQDKFASLGETVSKMAADVSKSFGAFASTPKQTLPMPALGDGRSQDQLRTTAELMYNIDTKSYINIAFIGGTQNAKEALINACRYTSDCLPGAGGIASPKNIAVQWTHCDPKYSHLRFWELGETSLGSAINSCLYAFDVVVFVVQDKLRQTDIDLIKQLNTFKPPTPVLITRTDMHEFIDKFFGLADTQEIIKKKTQEGQVLREAIKNQLLTNGINCPCTLKSIYLVSPPGMLAARAVNFDGTKYIWDEYDFMQGLITDIVKHRY